jgi:hypothetical protein
MSINYFTAQRGLLEEHVSCIILGFLITFNKSYAHLSSWEVSVTLINHSTHPVNHIQAQPTLFYLPEIGQYAISSPNQETQANLRQVPLQRIILTKDPTKRKQNVAEYKRAA